MLKHYAIVVSQFNQTITDRLLAGALNRFKELGIENESVTVVSVPGAVEIPLIAKLLAQSQRYAAIVALGAVIRGETTHYDYVCSQVSAGCQQVMLQCMLPVIFGVLTTENEEQAEARSGGPEGNKGADAAEAAVTMVNVVDKLGVEKVGMGFY